MTFSKKHKAKVKTKKATLKNLTSADTSIKSPYSKQNIKKMNEFGDTDAL